MFHHSLKLRTIARTAVRGRPTLKGLQDVERFRNGLNLMRDQKLYERSVYQRTSLSEPSIENYAISNDLSIELSNISVKPIHGHRQVSQYREPSGTVTAEEQERKG